MRIPLISVIGSGRHLDPPEVELAESLGEALAKEGYGIVCGGLGGVMEAVARGAVRGRAGKGFPPIIGLLPTYEVESGNAYLDIVMPTGMGHARNALVVAAGEVVVCVGGATGALSEVALARKMKRPVLAFVGSGGTARLTAKVLPTVVAVKSVPEAIRRIRALL